MHGNAFLSPPRRGWAARAVTATALLVVGMVGWWAPWRAAAVTHPPTVSPSMSAAPAMSATPSPTDDATITTSVVVDARIVDDLPVASAVAVLPRGRRRVAGFRVGYPRTTSGAVAAAVEDISHAGCLTPACVDATLQAGVDPSWPAARAHLVAGMTANRHALGIPDGVPVPAGAVMTSTPMAFQIVPIPMASVPAGDGAPRVRVLLLCYLAMAGPAVSPSNAVIVVPVTLRWTGTDFRQVAGDRSYLDLLALPGTPAARHLGWRDFVA